MDRAKYKRLRKGRQLTRAAQSCGLWNLGLGGVLQSLREAEEKLAQEIRLAKEAKKKRAEAAEQQKKEALQKEKELREAEQDARNHERELKKIRDALTELLKQYSAAYFEGLEEANRKLEQSYNAAVARKTALTQEKEAWEVRIRQTEKELQANK